MKLPTLITGLCATLLLTNLALPLAQAEEAAVKFDHMVGVPVPYTGSSNAIRGVSGGGLPWIIREGKAWLLPNGELMVKVRGLVFDPEDPVVIERGLANQNPVPFFKAILSCLTVDRTTPEAPVATTVNLETSLFPATTGLGAGDALIQEVLDGVPNPCIAPIVFVTSPGGSWFAATGF